MRVGQLHGRVQVAGGQVQVQRPAQVGQLAGGDGPGLMGVLLSAW